MTKEQWKERLPVIQAWIDGKTIQHRQLVDEWCDVGWANEQLTRRIKELEGKK